MVAPVDAADSSHLFAPPVRWGYEYVEPAPPAQSPEHDNPPSRAQVRRVPRPQAAGLQAAAVLAAVGSVGVIVLDSSLGVFSGETKGAAGAAVLVVHLLAAAIAFWAARAWQRSSPRGQSLGGSTSAVGRNLIPAVNAFICFFAPYIVLPIEVGIAWRRIWRGREDLVPHPGDAKRAEAQYLEAMSAWQAHIAQFEAAELKRFETVDLWYPMPLSQTAQMTCIFGGAPVSWTAALTTLGASLLGSGARIVIGDLLPRLTADVLCDLSRTMGIPTTEVMLPGGAASAELLADVSWNDLSTVLVEVLHSAQQDRDTSLRERYADRSVLREIAACLDASGPVSIARLRRALLVVQGEELAGNGDAIIDAAEHDHLTALFNEVQRQHGGVMERVTRIERALRDFELLDGRGPGQGGGGPGQGGSSPEQGDGGPEQGGSSPEQGGGKSGPHERPQVAGQHQGELRVIGIDKQTDDLENDRLANLLFQLLLRRVRQGWTQADVLVILGADRIRREALESLMTHAEQRHIGVLLFFEYLRWDAIEIVGGGRAAAAFFALGNHHEAQEASDFIGAEYKWVESQHTASASKSLTRTPSSEERTTTSGTLGFPLSVSLGHSRTRGRSYSEAFGQTREYAVSEQHVRKAVIQPEVLMSLPTTGMIYVEVLSGSRRITANLDCHPQVALSLRVAKEPRTPPPPP